MTLKARVAEFIREKKHSYQEWINFQKTVPEIRLKRLAKGQVVFNLSGKEGFQDPESWLANYEAGQKLNVTQAVITAREGIGNTRTIEALWDAGLSVESREETAAFVEKERDEAFSSGFETACRTLIARVLKSYASEAKRRGTNDMTKIGISCRQLFNMALIVAGYDAKDVQSMTDEETLSLMQEY